MASAFRAAGMECRLIVDGEGTLPAELLFSGAPAAIREREPVVVPYGCLLVRGDGVTALVDAGLGPYEHPLGGRGGRLAAELAAVGVAQEDVDLVLISHGHLDHIGGLCERGRPRFSRARHLMSRIEWDWWAAREHPIASEQLPPLQEYGAVELFDVTAEPVPGLRLFPAPGHTPGHTAVEIGGPGGVLFAADAIVDALHVSHPQWTMALDEDPEQAVATRAALVARAAGARCVLAAAHLPGPGTVERPDGGSSFAPLYAG